MFTTGNIQFSNGTYYFFNYTKRANWNFCYDQNLIQSSKGALNFKNPYDFQLINNIVNFLDPYICPNVVLCCVPSHRLGNFDTSMLKVVKELANRNRIDGSYCLIRNKTIGERKKPNSDRRKEVHFGSINPDNMQIFENRDVLLLDDIVTSGNSLDACKDILLSPYGPYGGKGAKSVVKLALWKTTNGI